MEKKGKMNEDIEFLGMIFFVYCINLSFSF